MQNETAKEIVQKNNNTVEQEKFINCGVRSDSILLISTAGSGKSYCAVERLKFLLSKGVDPKKIIFFSFTTAAVEELKKRINNNDIKITTIHAFCFGILAKVGKFKKISNFYDFIEWFKKEYKPKPNSIQADKDRFYNTISDMFENSNYYDSSIAAFKLQNADGIKSKLPSYIKEYNEFLKKEKARDFSDMLIEVRNLFKEDRWLKMFRGKYDYVFIDEYQDTSTIQMDILLSLNAKYYYLLGDKNQSIYNYSGTNCTAVEDMLKRRRQTVEMNLSTNFRSSKTIVENSNNYSNLKAIPFHQDEGKVTKQLITFEDLIYLFNTQKEVVVLVRTNEIIKELEKKLLMRKIPIRYFNYITKSDLDQMIRGDEMDYVKNKIRPLLPEFKTKDKIVEFIKDNENNKSFITSIHKAKGREFETCVVVNSISPELIKINGLELNDKAFEYLSFDPDNEEHFEAKNIHYVAISRPKKELYYMVYLKD